MSLPTEDRMKKLKINSVEAMRQDIMQKSPLFIFSSMSSYAFFINNDWLLKDKEFSTDEKDILSTLDAILRVEFGSNNLLSFLDKEKLGNELFNKFKTNSFFIIAYILVLHKDIIAIEAHNVVVQYLEEIISFEQTATVV